MTASTKRIRALATKGTKVGKTRYNLYKEAYARINESIQAGYCLEAIVLIESLVADRLESRLSFLKKKDISFRPLGKLIESSQKIETDADMKKLVENLNECRLKRNKAIHEMVKISDGEFPTWEARIKDVAASAKNGLSCLRAIARRCKQLRD